MGRERLRDDAKMAAGRLDFNSVTKSASTKLQYHFRREIRFNKGHEVSS